jgi:hypothetical protein
MQPKGGAIPKAYSCNTCYRKHPPPTGNKCTLSPDPEVLKKMAEKLAEQQLKEGGESALITVPGEGRGAEKDQSTTKNEVTLLATLVSRLAEQFNENCNDTASEIAELRSLKINSVLNR